MSLIFRCSIPGRVGIKKNSTQRRFSHARGRTVTMPSDRYLLWEALAVAHIRGAWKGKRPISGPVLVRFTFYFENRSAEPDLSNCYEGPQDALQKAGVITDDKIIQGHDGSRKVFGQAPRVEIEIYEMKE